MKCALCNDMARRDSAYCTPCGDRKETRDGLESELDEARALIAEIQDEGLRDILDRLTYIARGERRYY